jgi:hypothetical protein
MEENIEEKSSLYKDRQEFLIKKKKESNALEAWNKASGCSSRRPEKRPMEKEEEMEEILEEDL